MRGSGADVGAAGRSSDRLRSSVDGILYGETDAREQADMIDAPKVRRHRLGIRQAAVMQRLRQQRECILPAVKEHAETTGQVKKILQRLQDHGYVSSRPAGAGTSLKLWKLTADGEEALSESRYSDLDLLGDASG